MDEGDLTRRVVARYAATDGAMGQTAAEKVLPARRELWRLVEAVAPRALAAALRARLAPADQSGRGGVRELRAALADWLDPPPTCAHCGRHFDPARTVGPTRLGCPSRPQPKPWTPGRGRRSLPVPCAAHRGARTRTGHDAHPTVARCGTLALFTPLHLDPVCYAAAHNLKHGAALTYDVVVDRDARILFNVTTALSTVTNASMNPAHAEGPCATTTLAHIDHISTSTTRTNPNNSAVEFHRLPGTQFTSGHLRGFSNEHDTTQRTGHQEHADHLSTSSYVLIAAARRHLDRVLADAVEQNGRLILATQVKYFSPKAGVTRADLIQGGAMGCRRALLDYDANYRPPGKKRGVRFSTYGINWVHQGIGEVFADRELVGVPEWCVDLRADVEALGISPGLLLAGVMAVVEARENEERCLLAAEDLVGMTKGLVDLGAVGDHDVLDGDGDDGDAPEDAQHEGLELFVAHACHSSTASRLAAAARSKPARAKNPPCAARAAEQVAAVVVALLGLECGGGKPATGAALLTALRHGHAPTMVPVSTGGERDADGGDAGDNAGGGGGGADHARRLQSNDVVDVEEAAIEEEHDRRRHAATLAALASLRAVDPEAAEVVRRRHGLDGVGDGETLEEVVAAPLRCTGRTLCRESGRKAYKRGVAHLKAHAEAALPAGLFAAPVAEDEDDEADRITAPVRRPHGVFRPRRPAQVVTHVAAPLAPRTHEAHAPESMDPEAWAPAAMAF